MIDVMRRKNWKQGLEKYLAAQLKKEQEQEQINSAQSRPSYPASVQNENAQNMQKEENVQNMDNTDNTDNTLNIENEKKDEEPFKVNKRPKDDLSDEEDVENKQEEISNLKEIADFDVVDADDRWDKESALGIYEAFKEESYFDLDGEKQFVVDLKTEIKLKRVDIQFNGDSFAREINVFSSSTEDEYYDWIEIGVLQLHESIENNMKISVDINDYSHNRYLKIIFHSENAVQIKRIQFFA